MPLIEHSEYDSPSIIHRNRHISTIYAALIKKFEVPEYTREKHELNDGDFINIDYILNDSKKAVILCHGLEGDSRRTYNNSCAAYFLQKDFSVFAWNNRTCGGEMNRLPRLYHHGAVDDLDEVVRFALRKGIEDIYLIGYSMGGVQLLNYLGWTKIDQRIKAAVSISVPTHIATSAEVLKQGFNRVYLKNFTIDIKKKLKYKAAQFPDFINRDQIDNISTFDEVDQYFTAPLHGFASRDDYYERVSPEFSLKNITTPVLIINSLDDPFLGERCYPRTIAKDSAYVYLETPKYGGHCAFPLRDSEYSYAEKRAFKFFESFKSNNTFF
ncbi:YheT family hydrolase [Flavobacterium sharifuzzamanii]|uniref:YheT family hydrolase n=1 Tax=Flavobacterium sharifuzzamanii TaxID=2211133 RepID=UPI000DABA46E|nr:alpha/beta fold hydrolase [Flavobacterium sharifuzzamanii]KAF2079791.1 alpha/beta fold hydrolase [Flavobacterium sharifuzzamanii]